MNIRIPNDKFITYFLGQGYFHDSKIKSIDFTSSKGSLLEYAPENISVTIVSCADQDRLWEKLSGTHQEKKAYLHEHEDSFIYNVTFRNCVHYKCEKTMIAHDYITGEFLDTALLRHFQNMSKEPLYHFRILLDDGYMEFICSQISIEKKVGRKRIRGNNEDFKVTWLLKTQTLLHENGQLILEKVREVAHSQDDFTGYCALHYLLNYTKLSLIDVARHILAQNNDDERYLLAINILGKQGDNEDLEMLKDLLSYYDNEQWKDQLAYCNSIIPRVTLQDAIELITYRITNEK